jgi:hypothetical protein
MAESSSKQHPPTDHTDAPLTPLQMMANLKPMGGGRSIRRKSSASKPTVEISTSASKAFDELLQAAAAQSQPPVQPSTNLVSLIISI